MFRIASAFYLSTNISKDKMDKDANKNTEDNGTVTSLDDIKKARDVLYSSPDIVKTPLLCHVQNWFPSLPQDMDLYLKMENAQTTGRIWI